jgi:hypothetical protein
VFVLSTEAVAESEREEAADARRHAAEALLMLTKSDSGRDFLRPRLPVRRRSCPQCSRALTTAAAQLALLAEVHDAHAADAAVQRALTLLSAALHRDRVAQMVRPAPGGGFMCAHLPRAAHTHALTAAADTPRTPEMRAVLLRQPRQRTTRRRRRRRRPSNHQLCRHPPPPSLLLQ